MALTAQTSPTCCFNAKEGDINSNFICLLSLHTHLPRLNAAREEKSLSAEKSAQMKKKKKNGFPSDLAKRKENPGEQKVLRGGDWDLPPPWFEMAKRGPC